VSLSTFHDMTETSECNAAGVRSLSAARHPSRPSQTTTSVSRAGCTAAQSAHWVSVPSIARLVDPSAVPRPASSRSDLSVTPTFASAPS
jgi:hypothetical protein